MIIEVLRCKDCDRIVIAVSDCGGPSVRQKTTGLAAHRNGKCSGQWTVLAEADYDPNKRLIPTNVTRL